MLKIFDMILPNRHAAYMYKNMTKLFGNVLI